MAGLSSRAKRAPKASVAASSCTRQAALAMATSRVRIGVLVYAVGYRNPAILANAISTIDHLSGGRAQASGGGRPVSVRHGRDDAGEHRALRQPRRQGTH